MFFRRAEWKSFEIHLDHQISENQKALDRKEQYIKNQDYAIESLTQEKLSLETQLKNKNPLFESKSNRSEEIENYQKKLRQLSTTMADKEKTLETTKELHNIEISEMRYRFITTNSAYYNIITEYIISTCVCVA